MKTIAATGTDGWPRQDLFALPREMWNRFADVLDLVEESAEWPAALMSSYHFALKKFPKPKAVPQCQMRLILVSPSSSESGHLCVPETSTYG